MNNLIVYKASAGSGKTFTLAARYVARLMKSPTSYRKVLAVTFTNKATSEMKERILNQLKGISDGNPESDGFLAEVRKYCKQPEEEIRQTAGKVLTNIVHDYSRFRIETIDSFFQAVVRNLARELGLGSNMNIDLDNKAALSDAVDSIVESLDRQSNVLDWMIEYVEDQIEDNKTWRIVDAVKKFGINIFNERYIEKGEALRKKLDDPQFIKGLKSQLRNAYTESLEQMKSFAQQFFEVLEDHGILPEELKGGSKSSITSYFRKLQAGIIDDTIRTKTIEKCLVDKYEWVSKKCDNRDVILALAEQELIPLLNDSERLRAPNKIIINSCILTLANLDKLRLLNVISAEVRKQNLDKNRFLLSDTNALLRSLIGEDDASFVFEKIGTSVDTIMIDEFQDTSRMQWDNFRILMEESLSQQYGSLVVGDIKQSIYRWRNGDWRILSQVESGERFPVDSLRLATNWRSEQVVVEFNNKLFQGACAALNNRHQNSFGKPFEALSQAYDDVVQKTNKTDQKGYVSIRFIDKTTEEDPAESQLKLILEQVDTLVAGGVNPNDITILIRYNDSIPVIAQFFASNTSYTIVSDEAFRLDASLTLNIVVGALRYLSSPEDTVNLARLVINYQRASGGSGKTLGETLLLLPLTMLPESFTANEERLKSMPLYELIIELQTIFHTGVIQGEDAYVCSFFDSIIEYIRRGNSPSLPEFLKHWDSTLSGKTIPAQDHNGIRIMSIHKSKGLEFHTVILPYCDWDMETRHRDHLIWARPDSTAAPFNQIELMPVYYNKKSMPYSVYSKDFFDEQLQLWIDNLNLLYVGFTRASKNLLVSGTIHKSKTGEFTVASLLQESLQTVGEGYNPDDKTFTAGLVCPSAQIGTEGNESSDSRISSILPVREESTFTAKLQFRKSKESASFLSMKTEEDENESYASQGLLLHSLFSSIETASDIDSAILRLRFEGAVESDEHERNIRRLASWALNNPRVKPWFDGSWKLMNERSIIFRDSQGTVINRRPDRVMLKPDRSLVVDFKFGNPKEEHKQQVGEYVRLLEQMNYSNVEGYIWYIFKNTVVKL